MKSYNGIIELWRYLFTIMVGYMHFLYAYIHNPYVFEGAYLAVDFFFILSGYYLMVTIKKNKDMTAISFTIRKIKGLMWIYLSSVLLCLLFRFSSGIGEGLNALLLGFPSLLGIQMIGIFEPFGNSLVWYISAMLIVGYFLVFLERTFKDSFVGLIIPIIIVSGYVVCKQISNSLDLVHQPCLGGVHIGLIRGAAGMSLGVLIYSLFNHPSLSIFRNRIFSTFLFVVSVLVAFLLLIIYPHSEYDYFVLLFFPIIILFSLSKSFIGSSILDSIGVFLIKKLGKSMTLSLYCYSIIVGDIVYSVSNKITSDRVIIVFVYTVCWFSVSFIVTKISHFLDKKFFYDTKV